MKNNLIAIAIISISASAFAGNVSSGSDIDIDLKAHTQGQVIHKGQWANISSRNCVHVKNNTDDKKAFKYYFKLCVENAGCDDRSREFTVNSHDQWGEYCENLNVSKQFNGIGFREIITETSVSGDKNESTNSHATLRIDP